MIEKIENVKIAIYAHAQLHQIIKRIIEIIAEENLESFRISQIIIHL